MNEFDFEFAVWRKSSQSEGGTTGDCVEVAAGLAQGGAHHHVVGVRDSKNPGGPVLVFARAEWSTFVDHIRSSTYPQT